MVCNLKLVAKSVVKSSSNGYNSFNSLNEIIARVADGGILKIDLKMLVKLKLSLS